MFGRVPKTPRVPVRTLASPIARYVLEYPFVLRTWLQLDIAHTLASSRSQAMGGAPSAQIRAATWAQNLGADLRQKEHDHHTPRSFV